LWQDTLLLVSFLRILLQQGRINFIRQNSETPFPIHRRTWYCPSSLLLADYRGKTRSY